MADSFVSYARDDKTRIAGLVEALEAEGFSVFWDPEIREGADWELVIEDQLNAAKAVIVAWTDTSRRSQWVRAEAHEAWRQRKLIPLTFDDSGPPLFFKTVQSADFIGWDGDKSAECWQRLSIMLKGVLQAAEPDGAPAAYGDGEAAASPAPASPAPAAPPPTEPSSSAEQAAPVATKATPKPPARGFPWIDLLVTLLAVGGLVVASRFDQGVLGVGIVLAAAVFVLFQAADAQMPPASHALAKRWLMPVRDGLRINVAEAFHSMFQAVFWHRHFSLRCLFRSALASTIAFAAIFAFCWLFIAPFEAAFRDSWGPFLRNLIITFLLANIAADYVSLLQTRLFIRFLVRRPQTAPLVVLLDFIATLAILAAVLYVVNAGAQWLSFAMGSDVEARLGEAGGALGDGEAAARDFQWPSFTGFYQSLIPQLTNPQAGIADFRADGWLLIVAACTTYITSIWLLFILVFGSLLRALVGRDGQPTWFGRVLSARTRPFTALGAVSAGLALGVAAPVHALLSLAPQQPEPPTPEPGDLLIAQATPASQRVPVSATDPATLPDFALFRECEACPEMAVIPAGGFTMGSPASEVGHGDEEGPQRAVSVERFAVGRFEVTWDEWEACVSAGGCDASGPQGAGGDEGWGRGRRPVINVSWDDARAYVGWLNGQTEGAPYRLLTEAEWEYAARAGTTTPWSTGETITTAQANFAGDNRLNQTAPVGGYAANPFGLFDMHGNVLEWVEDCYVDSYADAPTNGSAVNGDSPNTNECSHRVLRGGSWYYPAQLLRSADRVRDLPANRNHRIGFRLARTVSP